MIMRLVALLLTLGVVLSDLPAFAAGLARLTEYKGDVQVQPKDGAWHAAQANEELNAGDTVKTGAQSSATVTRQDGTELELMPFAQLSLADENGFLLNAGKVWSHFMKSLGVPFFIRTPNATALIRGTTLEVGFEEERSRVVVYEGLVEVQGRDGGHEDVAGGFRVDVDRTGRLERLERADTRELDEGRMFRIRRGLDERPQPGMREPGRNGDRRERPGDRPDRGGGPRGREGRETPRQDRMDRPSAYTIEGLERRMDRVEQRLGERLEVREDREQRVRERRQEALDAAKRMQERTDRQEREDTRLRDLLPGVLP
ncbi:MAG TPA: FecR family protein [Stenomitos sp.]